MVIYIFNSNKNAFFNIQYWLRLFRVKCTLRVIFSQNTIRYFTNKNYIITCITKIINWSTYMLFEIDHDSISSLLRTPSRFLSNWSSNFAFSCRNNLLSSTMHTQSRDNYVKTCEHKNVTKLHLSSI